MNSFILTVNGAEYRLKMQSRMKVDAEKKLGESILKSLFELDKTEVFAILLWASIQQFNHGIALGDVYDIIDEMEEYGCQYTDPTNMKEIVCDPFSISDRERLVMAILKVSGFFTAAEIEELNKTEAETDEMSPKKKTTRKKSSTPPQH